MAGDSRYKTLFYAHEVATVRPLIEEVLEAMLPFITRCVGREVKATISMPITGIKTLILSTLSQPSMALRRRIGRGGFGCRRAVFWNPSLPKK